MRLKLQRRIDAGRALPVEIWARSDRYDGRDRGDARPWSARVSGPIRIVPDWNATNDIWGDAPAADDARRRRRPRAASRRSCHAVIAPIRARAVDASVPRSRSECGIWSVGWQHGRSSGRVRFDVDASDARRVRRSSHPSAEFAMPGFGVWASRWWMPVLFIVVAGHLTNVCVTLFLHRAQTHRGVRLHYLAALPMRLWLWLTTAIVTKEWVACHRKHHAFADREGDPHSPLIEGLRNIVLQGRVLLSQGGSPARHAREVRQGHAERLDRAPPAHAAQLARHPRDARRSTSICSASSSARSSGACRCSGSRSGPPASSTASATRSAIATSR